jgi:hypothetical protein
VRRDYQTLDAIVVVGSMAMTSGIALGFFVLKVEPEVAPILSSMGTAIIGIPVAYGAFRWGNKMGRDEVRIANTASDPVPVEETK